MTGAEPEALARARAIPRHLSLLYGVFFLSGFSALIYQTAWQRMLGLFAGSDMVATTLVVGAFLFGLGIGSLGSASFADGLSHRRALLAFAVCELGIAIFASASPFLFYDLVFGQLIAFADSPIFVALVVFIGLLPPTILMGMSLPLLSRAVVQQIETASSEIGWLYGVNTLGASCGALGAGFVLLGTFGYEVTVYFAALLNLLVFVGALFVASSLPDIRPLRNAPTARRSVSRIPRQIWIWSLIVFISGFLIISLEIIWFRVLGVLMQTNAYAFPLILSFFLIGDAAGILYGARVARKLANPFHFFQWLQGAMTLYAVVSLGIVYWIIGDSRVSPWFTDGSLARSEGWSTLLYISIYSALTLVCVLPPAFLLGMSFPITQKAVQDDPGLVGQRVGQIQLFNIFGNTCGAIVTGLVLLHWIGTSGTIRLVGLAGLAFLVALSWQKLRNRERVTPRSALPAALLAVAILMFPGNIEFWSRLHGTKRTIAGEDRTGVVVLRHVARADVRHGGESATDPAFLYISGHAQSRVPFLPIHGALGIVGPLIHPNPQTMLLIGYGSGATPYAAGINPKSKRIRVIELIQPVYPVMERFTEVSDNISLKALAEDPRVERLVGDGRHFLYTDKSLYDVVQADAIYPSSSHAGLLYSVEFFRGVQAHLKDGGLYVQWAATERTIASFVAVFPYVIRLNEVLIGSNQPIPYSKDLLASRIRSPEMRRYLSAAQLDPDNLLSLLTEIPERVWRPEDPRTDKDMNTDLFPKDEYFLNQWKVSILGSGDIPPSR